MIRWKYALPRLALAAVVVTALAFGLDPLLKWALVSIGQSVTGARVSIGHAVASWTGTQVNLSDVQVADPRSRERNLFQVDRVAVHLDANALSRRKYIVDRAEAQGLRFATGRDASGALTPSDGTAAAPGWGDDAARWGDRWFDNALALLQNDLDQQFESVRLTKDLADRWPREYDRLEARAESLRQRIERLRQAIKTTEDPRRAVEAYPQVAADLKQIRHELVQLRAEADRLRQQTRTDKAAIAQAKQRTFETVRNQLRLENISGERLSEYLLGPDLGPPVVSMLDWIRWGRRLLPTKPTGMTAHRGRGVDVSFPGRQVLPDLLIRTMAMQGQGRIEGRVVDFEGTVTGLTNQPDVYGHPARLRLKTGGAANMMIQAVMDRRKGASQDQVLIDCPKLDQPTRVLGDPDRLSVTVSSGQAHAWSLMRLDGDTLNGEIVLKQEPVDLTPHLGTDLQQFPLTPALRQALAEVKTLDVTIDLSGSMDKPHWKVRSNLGPKLAHGINRAVQEQLAERREQIMARAEQQIANQVESLERTALARRESILEKLQLGDAEIDRMVREVAGPLKVPGKLLGSDGPLRGLFRR